MNLRSRSLLGVNSPPTTTTTTATTTVTDQSATENSDSDFVVILAALLCALICVLGLVAVARCAWIRRISGRVIGRPDPSPPAANKGLKKKILKSLPKLTYSAAEEDDESTAAKFTECSICLSEFVAGDELRVLPQCGHGFHVGCIDTWLGSHSSCPSCRQILAVTSRCKKCGELPENSVAGAVTGSRPTEIPVNPFLP